VIADYITAEREKKRAAAAEAEMQGMISALTRPGGQRASDAVIDREMDVLGPDEDIHLAAKIASERPGGMDAVRAGAVPKTRAGRGMLLALTHDEYRQRREREAAELKHQRAIELKRVPSGTGGNAKYSNTPIWGTNEEGESVLMQSSSAGGPLSVAKLPEGVIAQRGGTRTVDLGDRFAILDANGNLIGYRAKGIDPEKTPEHAGLVEGTKKAAALSMKIAGEAWESLGKVSKNIGNINDAIAAIDDGANTGPIYKMLPSISAASVELDNIQNRMGLDVIGTVTFGALSKGELDLALSTALPTGLTPPKLRKWLVEKRSAQAKLSKYLTSAAIYLGKPGNTVSKWAEMQAKKQAERQKTKAKVPPVTSSPTPKVNPTLEEILEELKRRKAEKRRKARGN
tara:strand:+ start:860 stop:2059 length:1200 start_codon:yes stop_codon:yes gene_type:complete